MGNGKTPWWALAGAGMVGAPLPTMAADGDGIMNLKPKVQPEETQASPDQVAAEKTSNLIDALGMPQPEQEEPSPARTIMQIHKDGVEEMKAKDNPLAGVMEKATPVVRRFATIPFNSFGRNIGHALHANQVEKTRARIQERKKQEELGAPIEDDLQMQQEPVENVFDKAFGAVGDFVGDLFGVQAAAAQSIDSSQYNDRDTTETREDFGIKDIHDKNFAAAWRSFNWTAINKVQKEANVANFEVAFAGKHSGDMMLPQDDGTILPVPAFETPEDGIRYFGWWLSLKDNPSTLREISEAWWPDNVEERTKWVNSVSTLSGIELDDVLSEPVMGDLFHGIAAHEGDHAFTKAFGETHNIDVGRYIREGREMHREAAVQLNQLPGGVPEARPTTVPDKPLGQNPIQFIFNQNGWLGLNENNPAHKATIEGFFNSSGVDWVGTRREDGTLRTIQDEAWCGVFVDHVLNELGVKRISGDRGKPSRVPYDRMRAKEYARIGEGVEWSVDDFSNARRGDIVVKETSGQGHVGFYAGGGMLFNPSRSENVKAIQEKLTELGFNPGEADGIYGKKTAAAIEAYQTANNMTANGVITEGLYKQVLGVDEAPKQNLVLILGGNQDDRVSIMAVPASEVTAIRRIHVEDLSDEDYNNITRDIQVAASGRTR